MKYNMELYWMQGASLWQIIAIIEARNYILGLLFKAYFWGILEIPSD
jgi:hypothetical protein